MNKIESIDIPGYEKLYQATSDGRIVRASRYVFIPGGGRRLFVGGDVQQTQNTHGYLCARLRKNGNRNNLAVHKLIALAFFGECPDGSTINHINGIKLDNNLSNLEYINSNK